jgi:hypothetical protein
MTVVPVDQDLHPAVVRRAPLLDAVERLNLNALGDRAGCEHDAELAPCSGRSLRASVVGRHVPRALGELRRPRIDHPSVGRERSDQHEPEGLRAVEHARVTGTPVRDAALDVSVEEVAVPARVHQDDQDRSLSSTSAETGVPWPLKAGLQRRARH